ncbi:hypothetical protein [Nostoc sp.]|uniref:hypothetical protein n=1 Tax=Nostoc sp. TaxID=1180 RepID=UPI002FF89C41
MVLHDYVALIVGIITILSALYKFVIEPSIDNKISSLQTSGFLLIDNLKDKLGERITVIDRKVDIHLQDYANYKETNLLHFNGLNEKIIHSWNKTKELFHEEKTDRKEAHAMFQKQNEVILQKQHDLQKQNEAILQKQHDLQIRE